MSEGGSSSAGNNCYMTDDDGQGPPGEGRDGVVNEFQGPSGCGHDRMRSGGLVSNSGPGPTIRGHDEASENGPVLASRGRDMACDGGIPHLNPARRGLSADQWSRPVERMLP